MRYLINETFDASELNRCFDADICPTIGKKIRTQSGKWYRIKDIVWFDDPFDHHPNIRVLLKRIQ